MDELEKYNSIQGIQEFDLDGSLDISHLELVCDASDLHLDCCYRTRIDCSHTILLCAAKLDVPNDLRQNWREEDEGLILRLHAAGFVQGEAKADNILIDQDNNA